MKQAVRNNLFILGLLRDAAPSFLTINVSAAVLETVFMIAQLVYFRVLMDLSYSGSEKMLLAASTIVSYIILRSIAASFFIWANSKHTPVASVKIQQHIQLLLFRKLSELDYPNYDTVEFYDRYIRATGEVDVRALEVAKNFIEICSCIAGITSLCLFIGTINPVFLLFVLGSVVNSVIMVAKQNKHIYSSQIEGTRPFRLREYVKRVFFLADYAQELRLYGFGRVLEERYSEASKEQAGVVEKHAGKYTHINAVGNIVGIAIRNSMLILLCFLVADGRMFPGDFLVVINSANQLSVFFIDLSEKLPQISLHSMFIENLRLILDCQTKFDEEVVDGQKPDEVGPVDIALELKNLSFAYPFMPIATLTNINIKVLKKQKVAIVGYNGAGKSTILKLLLRLYDPSEGEIYLNSKSYKSYGIGELRRKFAVVFQNARHYALTISENVLGRSVHGWEDEELVWEALELSGLKDKVERMRGKLSAVLTKEFDDSGIVFSGGELQKLAIARAYAQNADIIIMDEPTSSLDPVSENEIFNRMLKLCRDKTVIFISHKMALAACADYIYVIEEGSVVEEGTPSQLMNANGAYAALHRMQAKGYGGFEA